MQEVLIVVHAGSYERNNWRRGAHLQEQKSWVRASLSEDWRQMRHSGDSKISPTAWASWIASEDPSISRVRGEVIGIPGAVGQNSTIYTKIIHTYRMQIETGPDQPPFSQDACFEWPPDPTGGPTGPFLALDPFDGPNHARPGGPSTQSLFRGLTEGGGPPFACR